MNEELRKEIEELLYKYFKVYNITNLILGEEEEPPNHLTVVGELLALVEREKEKAFQAVSEGEAEV